MIIKVLEVLTRRQMLCFAYSTKCKAERINTRLVLFQNRHNIQYIAFLGIYSSVLYSLKGSIENRFFKFFAYIFFLNADYNIFT